MDDYGAPSWGFLTNHAQVLVCIAQDPGLRLRDIAEHVKVTERAAHRIVTELDAAGYIKRERTGRRNRYTINAQFPIPDPIAGARNIGALLDILPVSARSLTPRETSPSDRPDDRALDEIQGESFPASDPPAT